MNEKTGTVIDHGSPGCGDRTENLLLKGLLTQIQVGVVILDENYTVRYFNDKACEYTAMNASSAGEDIQMICGRLVSEIWARNHENAFKNSFDFVSGGKHNLIGLMPFMVPTDEGRFKIFYFLHLTPVEREMGPIVASKKMAVEDYHLSEREIQILNLMAEGCSNREIANYLSVSIHTVKTHNENIFKKLQVSGRVAAVNKYFSFRDLSARGA